MMSQMQGLASLCHGFFVMINDHSYKFKSVVDHEDMTNFCGGGCYICLQCGWVQHQQSITSLWVYNSSSAMQGANIRV